MSTWKKRTLLRVAITTAALYAVVGSLWILASDAVLHSIVRDVALAHKIEVYKGWAFILVTSLLLYITLRGQLARWDKEASARRAATEALKQSEERYRLTMNSIRDVIFQSDAAGHWTFLSQPWEEITGFTVQETLGKSYLDFVVAEDREENARMFRELIQREKEFCQHPVRYLKKQGGFCWVEVHARLIIDASNRVIGTAGSLRDITARQEMDASLRKFEEHLQQAAKAAGVGTFEHNHLTGEMYLSPLMREAHGFRDDERITAETLMSRIFPEDRERAAENLARAHHSSGSEKHFVAEHRIQLPHGEIRWMRVISKTSFEGSPPSLRAVRTLGACVDITETKRAEEALREREAQYRAVIETSADGFLILDMDGRVLETNDAYVRRSGYSRDELLRMNISDLDNLLDPEQTLQRIRTVARDGYALFETLHRTKDGTIWQAEADISFWPISGGRLFVFVRDINQRKRSEALLRTRAELSRIAENDTIENLLKLALDRMEIFTGSRISCVHLLDTTQSQVTLHVCSTATCAVLKNPLPAPIPVAASPLLNECVRTHGPVMENSTPPSDPFLLSSNSGFTLQRRLSVPVIREGTVTAIVCVGNKSSDFNAEDLAAVEAISGAIMDLVERKRAEDALRESEERNRALVETSFDWIWEVDADLRYTYSSPRISALLGYEPEELIGRRSFDFMKPEEAARMRPIISAAFSRREPFAAVEKEYVHRNGHAVFFESSGVPVFGPGNVFKGYRGSDRNITERKLAERERQILEAQLRQAQKMEAIGTLAGGVAHDFNNILTVIHGNASLLLAGNLKSLDPNECAQQIVRAAERAAGLTRQLLMFSRKQVMQLSNVNLNDVVGNLTKMLQRILGEDITLQTTYAPQLNSIRGDTGMIEQILLNLVVNARDAMPKGGTLTVATGKEQLTEQDAQRQPDARPGNYVWLKVTDTGTGIRPEILPRIFEPFFTTKEVGKGTGLGLATVYGIVKQHRGWLTVDTALNKGSSFCIFFPALASPSATPRKDSIHKPLITGTETILAVEDDPAVRKLMVSVLERCGYRVLQAPSGRAALDLWREHGNEVALLLTDVVMPDGVTGFQLAEKLKQERPSLKVIFVTGYSADLADKGTSLVEGVNFLQKPFPPESLARALRAQLDATVQDAVRR